MSQASVYTPSVNANDYLKVTSAAITRIAELLAEEEDAATQLRIYIEGGGCSGFQYGFILDEERKEDDTMVSCPVAKDDAAYKTRTEIHIYIDPLSLQYLTGAELDYKDDVEGQRFIIRNPHAQTTCGCGNSFSLKEEESD
ncbi:MAG: erpA [Gammaproteobacteria bacterium]|jgi:iron-sulfur cluster insertion protein|nr:erpA [Gammaproteobacteria bacterium]